MNERILGTDNAISAMVKLAEGNPGALTVMMQMLDNGGKIDPQDFMGGLGSIFHLDSLGIYGPRIWMLYKDVCGESLVNTLAVLRACQLGILPRQTLNHAIDNYGDGIDVANIYAAVTERLVEFDMPVDGS